MLRNGLEFHPGEPGAPGEGGKDHWHKVTDGKKEKPHLKRGDEVEVPIADDAAVPNPNFQGEPEGFWRVNNPWAWVAGTVLVGVAVAVIVIALPVAVGAAAEIGGVAFFTSGIFVAGA